MRYNLRDLFLVLSFAATANVLAYPVDAPESPLGIDPAAANGIVAKTMFQGNQHATDLLWPLLVHNTDACSSQAQRLGFTFFDVPQASDDGDVMIARNLGLVLGTTVDHVIPNSPLADAGLLAGDQVVAINGVPVATGRHAGRASNAILARGITAAGTTGAVQFAVAREGKPLTLSARPVTVCDTRSVPSRFPARSWPARPV